MLAWWRKFRKWVATKTPRYQLDLTVEADGLIVAKMEHEEVVYLRVPWDDIEMAVAYMKDCYSVDQVRVELMLRSSEESIVITEDDVGFSIFVAELGKHLNLIEPEWYGKLIAVPFNPEWQVFYRRDKAEQRPLG
jgi:hypothetical protein